jgi:tetratricopeptide (TPR) repeat protein
MLYCANCGNKVHSDHVFCGTCGTRQRQDSVSSSPPKPARVDGTPAETGIPAKQTLPHKVCAACNEAVAVSAIACPKCGRGVFETPKTASEAGKGAFAIIDIPKAMTVLDDVGLLTLEKMALIERTLDVVAASGENGAKALLEVVARGLRLGGATIGVSYLGQFADFERSRKRFAIKALGRARCRQAVPVLAALVRGATSDSEFQDTVQSYAATALGDIGAQEAVTSLEACLQNSGGRTRLKAAAAEALGRLQGLATVNPWEVIKKAEKLFRVEQSEERLRLLDQIDTRAFDRLSAQEKYYVWYLRGMAHKSQGDRDRAIACLEAGLKFFNSRTALAWKDLEELRRMPGRA